jgi:O-acetyl-ADP-ribose deacetylase (regulator of RNase III)
MPEMQVSAWVTPTTPTGGMDSGLELVIKRFLGEAVEKRVQQQIRERHGGALQVGMATCVATGRTAPRYLISTTIVLEDADGRGSALQVALASAAALQAVHEQNEVQPGSIRSVALPGLGAGSGGVPAETCADAMWAAYRLFRERSSPDLAQRRAALEAELARMGSSRWRRFAATAGFPAAMFGLGRDPDTVDTADGEHDEDQVDTEDAEDGEAGGRR